MGDTKEKDAFLREESGEQETHSCCQGISQIDSVEKLTIRSEDNKKKMINRLRRIEGQVRGLESMIERDVYCNDILQQSAAVNAAINAFNRELIANHMRNCVARDIRDGNDQVIDELVTTLQKLMK